MTPLAFTNPGEHVFWIASRASGVVAIALMSFSVIVGLTMGGGLLSRFNKQTRQRTGTETRDLMRIHEYASLAALIAIAAHGLTLLSDSFLHPTLSQILIPFQIDHRPFFTGLGVIGAYVMAALGLSYYLRDRIGVARWKKLHRWTIAGWALSVIHVFGAGTDAGTDWLKYPMIAVCATVVVLFLLRVSQPRGGKPAGVASGGRVAQPTATR